MARKNTSIRPRAKANTDDGTTVLPTDEQSVEGLEEKALEFAEDLGRLFGTVQRKANDWLNQRQEAVRTLTRLRNAADQLLEQLGDASTTVVRRRGRGAAAGSDTNTRQAAGDGGTARRTRRRRAMSAAQRKAVGERMRKYWAERRKADARK